MKTTHAALAALISLAAAGAHATDVSFVNGMQASTDFDFATAVSGTGDAIYTTSSGIAAEPGNTNADGFLSVQPGQTAVVTLGGVYSVSFEWGTPDPTWNSLDVKLSNGDVVSFTPVTLGLTSADTYVDFTAAAGLKITSLTFDESTNPAFEASNFKVTAVPEPTNVALLLAGLGIVGVLARRRRA